MLKADCTTHCRSFRQEAETGPRDWRRGGRATCRSHRPSPVHSSGRIGRERTRMRWRRFPQPRQRTRFRRHPARACLAPLGSPAPTLDHPRPDAASLRARLLSPPEVHQTQSEDHREQTGYESSEHAQHQDRIHGQRGTASGTFGISGSVGVQRSSRDRRLGSMGSDAKEGLARCASPLESEAPTTHSGATVGAAIELPVNVTTPRRRS